MNIITKLDDNFNKAHSSLTYPYLKVLYPGDELTVLLPAMHKGSLPVIVESDGQLIQVAKVECDPINLMPLVKVYELEYHKDAETCQVVTSMKELGDLFDWIQ